MHNISESLSGPINADGVSFSTYERRGVIIMAVSGIISCSLVSALLLCVIFPAAVSWSQRKPDSPVPFIQKQVAVFIVCLLISDLIQSISGILQVKWAIENRIYEGGACIVQATTLVMGDLGSTIWSCVIATHTFRGLSLGKRWSRPTVWAIVIIGWSTVIILTIIGPILLQTPINGPFFGIAGDWCFITSNYAIPRLVIHYIPLFIAAVTILVLYVLVFLALRKHIKSMTPHVQLYPMSFDDSILRERAIIAKRMLWYPFAYLTCIFPIAIIRLVGLKEQIIPDSVWIFGMFFLFLLGAVDSVIYTITRKVIRPVRLPLLMHKVGSDGSTVPIHGSCHNFGDSDISCVENHHAISPTQSDRMDKVRVAQNISGPPCVQSGATAVTPSEDHKRSM